ncbi:unnamed protein product [Phytophthora fragariaefolia]|uniref:Unnamed protein product n=1 Tax=Phytophthora fragariaefolia TaxID=1490495 RepID=A0A9W6TRG7_9STRA|nr:unnamed protein product [Phytophthora fragariaefolia]
MRKRTVYLSGVDLLDETPILDIKPKLGVHPTATHRVRTTSTKGASDVTNTTLTLLFACFRIEWESATLISTVHKLAEKSVHYRGTPETFVAAIEEVLQVDVRSKYQTRRWTSPDYVNYQIIDNVRVQYRFALLPQPQEGNDSSIDTARIELSAVEEATSPVLLKQADDGISEP